MTFTSRDITDESVCRCIVGDTVKRASAASTCSSRFSRASSWRSSTLLAHSGELFRRVAETIPQAVWRTHLDGSADYFSQRLTSVSLSPGARTAAGIRREPIRARV